MMYLMLAWGLLTLALAGMIWYYRSRYLAAEAAFTALSQANAGQVALGKAMEAQAQAAREALAARQKAEAQHDAQLAEAAAGDPDRAAALLNGLHPNGASAGADPADPVPAGSAPSVP